MYNERMRLFITFWSSVHVLTFIFSLMKLSGLFTLLDWWIILLPILIDLVVISVAAICMVIMIGIARLYEFKQH